MEDMEIKTEIKVELIDINEESNEEIKIEHDYEIAALPEFVAVNSVESEPPDLEILEIIDAELVIPENQIPQRKTKKSEKLTINFADKKKIRKNVDISIFRMTPEEQLKKNGKAFLTVIEFGKYFLSTISHGSTALKLPAGWRSLLIKEPPQIKLLLSEMTVVNGIPTMQRQVVIDSYLKISLFFGARHVIHQQLSSVQIRSPQCVQALVAMFAHLKMCPGLVMTIKGEHFLKFIKYDNFAKVYRHRQCEFMHQALYDQCPKCKYFEVREKKQVNKFKTTDMLLNSKQFQRLHMKIKRLNNYNKKLQVSRKILQRKFKIINNENKELRRQVDVLNLDVKVEDTNVSIVNNNAHEFVEFKDVFDEDGLKFDIKEEVIS